MDTRGRHAMTSVGADVNEASSALWFRTAAEPPLAAPILRGRERASLLVIGGGITGLSTAVHLVEMGFPPRDIVVLEAGRVAEGASGRSGGQVIPGLKVDLRSLTNRFGEDLGRRFEALASRAADRVFDLVERYRIDCAPVRAGWLQGAHAPGAADTIRRRAKALAEAGAPVSYVDADEFRQRTGTGEYVGGLFDLRAGTVQPMSYARGLARVARAAGVRVFEGSRARHLARAVTSWHVATAEGSVAAEQVVLATDGYTDATWPDLHRTLLIVQSLQVATEPLQGDVSAAILPGREAVSETRRIAIYFRRDEAGRLVFGGRGACADEERGAFFGALEAKLARIFPALRSVRIESRWAGAVSLTVDHLPHLHEPTPGLHAAIGYNGRGIAMATVIGEVLARRIMGARPQEVDVPVTPVRPLPWHPIRRPLLAAGIAYYRLRDRLGLAS
jgi:sarcosine oxidase